MRTRFLALGAGTLLVGAMALVRPSPAVAEDCTNSWAFHVGVCEFQVDWTCWFDLNGQNHCKPCYQQPGG